MLTGHALPLTNVVHSTALKGNDGESFVNIIYIFIEELLHLSKVFSYRPYLFNSFSIYYYCSMELASETSSWNLLFKAWYSKGSILQGLKVPSVYFIQSLTKGKALKYGHKDDLLYLGKWPGQPEPDVGEWQGGQTGWVLVHLSLQEWGILCKNLCAEQFSESRPSVWEAIIQLVFSFLFQIAFLRCNELTENRTHAKHTTWWVLTHMCTFEASPKSRS